MRQKRDDLDFLHDCLGIVSLIAQEDAQIPMIAEHTAQLVTEIIKDCKDEELMTSAFRILGLLAFDQSTIDVLLQHQTIELIVDVVVDHAENRDLVSRCIQTLDNIAMGSAKVRFT